MAMTQRVFTKEEFKSFLLKRNFGLDGLMQVYMTYKEFDDMFLWNNPFAKELNAVFELINEMYPEVFS
jgi:hypothetical protein